MAEQTSQEPTMEEILASIRRIISEDETPEADSKETSPAAVEEPAAPEPEPAAAAAPEPEPQPEPPPPAAAPEPPPVKAAAQPVEDEDDALELTDKVETHGDLDIYTPSEDPAAAAPPPAPAPVAAAAPAAEAAPGPSLVSDTAAAAAATAFGKLSQVIAMPADGRTLEDVVRELLRPLLQQWLDDNLPGIVQESVQAEVDRIARNRVR
ncbi:MAG: DUF2497 domain-containing protein [Phenylobacterium sp.]|nr:MAG: DUF2497 domain-containing protein [Phenylobacterium sp.]